MTAAEWQTCQCPLPMLIFLRGEVSEALKRAPGAKIVSGHGYLLGGPGQYISADQCQRFILRCACRLWDLPLDEASWEALAAYRRHVLHDAPRDKFFQACKRIHEQVVPGRRPFVSHLAVGMWTDDPLGAATAAGEIAWTIANERAKESVAVTCSSATEDDWFAWGFSGNCI